MRRLTSSPKPSWRVCSYRLVRSPLPLRMAVADAVVAGQVRARLGRGQDVVGRQAVARVRQRRIDDLAAELLDPLERRLEHLAHAVLDALAGQLGRHAELEATQVCARGQVDVARVAEGRTVARVAADHVAQQQRGVRHVAREGPALVERRRERDHPVARHAAVGRLQPDQSAERRGLADRAAGVGADRPRHQAGGDGRGAAARRPAGHALGVPRVADRAVAGVLVRRAHRELVHVGLAEHRRAGVLELLDRRGGVGRLVAVEDATAARAGHAVHAEQVLDAERHAAERGVGCRAPGGRPRRAPRGTRPGRRPPPARGRGRTARRRRPRPSGSSRPPARP